MPNRQTHGIVGLATGGVTALWLAQTQSRAEQALELLGGASAAWVAARLPDLIDLPTSPNHRSIGHSALLYTGGVAASAKTLSSWQHTWRERSEEAKQSGDSLSWFLWRVLAGMPWGFVAGYASHLALDMCTPKGLPF